MCEQLVNIIHRLLLLIFRLYLSFFYFVYFDVDSSSYFLVRQIFRAEQSVNVLELSVYKMWFECDGAYGFIHVFVCLCL